MTNAGTLPKDVSAKFLAEDIERCKKQIGVARYLHGLPFNTVSSRDAIRHFAFSCGEDNPLWQDRNYGSHTRWKDQIAPPMFYVTLGLGTAPKPDEATKSLFRGLFKGVSKYYAGVEWTWWRPLYADTEIYEDRATADVSVREKSSFSGGMTVTEVYRHLYMRRDGALYAMRNESFVSAEREGSIKAGKHAGLQRQSYSADDIAKLNSVYAAEERRGSTPRYWEEVQIGDTLTPVAKGPLSMADIISYHIGQGLSHYGVGPLRLGWAQRTRMPGFYTEDRYGVPEPAQRVHWDHERAQELGLPTAHDYGQMRANWLAHLITNWIGDDGWLWKLALQTRAFNFMGDFSVCSGEVTGKRTEGALNLVDIKVECRNQRGEVTAPGSATVILPTKSQPAVLPAPPQDLAARGTAIMTALSQRENA
jgi:acyl dehydratase